MSENKSMTRDQMQKDQAAYGKLVTALNKQMANKEISESDMEKIQRCVNVVNTNALFRGASAFAFTLGAGGIAANVLKQPPKPFALGAASFIVGLTVFGVSHDFLPCIASYYATTTDPEAQRQIRE